MMENSKLVPKTRFVLLKWNIVVEKWSKLILDVNNNKPGGKTTN